MATLPHASYDECISRSRIPSIFLYTREAISPAISFHPLRLLSADRESQLILIDVCITTWLNVTVHYDFSIIYTSPRDRRSLVRALTIRWELTETWPPLLDQKTSFLKSPPESDVYCVLKNSLIELSIRR